MNLPIRVEVGSMDEYNIPQFCVDVITYPSLNPDVGLA